MVGYHQERHVTSGTTCQRELSGEEAQDQVNGRRLIRNIDRTTMGKDAVEEEECTNNDLIGI